ncbi:ATP-binding cassette domain-containing protein [Pirellulaceae bacterium SH501]
MIELRRLHRFFGATKAVHDVSFEVYRGQVFGYIGPNGAGKTTSMRILSTLELPSYGDAFIDGFSAVNDPDLVRRRLGFMPDGFSVYPNMNCVEYLDFFARSYGLIGKDRIQAIKRTLGFTGLDKIASKPITGLSKGMRQRLCLGRAMIHQPTVLVLDEPANGLDPRARIELRQMIQLLAAEGTTVLVSSHILTELAEMCDQVGIIERGKLLAVGSVEEIRRTMRGHLRVRVVPLSRQEEITSWLSQREGVNELGRDGNAIHFSLQGGEAEQSQLLTLLIQAGFPILEFAAHTESLEDVFMKITTGAVQ